MTYKYTFGKPIETDAVVLQMENADQSVPYVTMKETGFTYDMEKSDIVYGLGENVRGINKRGWVYQSRCTDDPSHTEDKRSLYAAHNFIIVEGKETFGVFVDTPSLVTFDIGYTNKNVLDVEIPDGDYYLYIIEGENPYAIVKEFRKMIGKSYIAPKWAFGYGQSRWSYMNEDEIREVVAEHQKNDIPLDSIYLDIDYMERYKDFTVDEKAFPEFEKFVKEMKDQNIHLVPIIDAGVKIEEGYDTYEEGMENGYFCKKENGEEFVAGVWPGRVHFPDVLNDDARRWFGNKYQFLLDQGIDGFWNDMNEPAIFYSEDHLNEVFDKIDDYKSMNLDVNTFFEFKDMVLGIANNTDDYKRFYHSYKGETIRHDKVHNLFGYNMTRAAGEAFDRLRPEERILMFSRSSYIGMHRYGGIWQGDNLSWWSHILLNLRMLPSLNMCGVLYTGADLGGFGADTTEDLVMRWLELGIFTPLMRNHSAMGTRRQEAYRFQDTEDFKNIIGIRYGLLPYLYSEYMKAALKDEMYFLPLSFVYAQDERAKQIEDQLMVGESIMIAPVYEQNKSGRYVYLPEEMKMYRMRSLTDMDEEILSKGDHYVKAELNEVLIFVRPDHIVPMSCGGNNVASVEESKLKVFGFVKDKAKYELYNDDGVSKDYDLDKNTVAITAYADGRIEVDGNADIEVEKMF